jgi:hypothetical protein
MPVVSVCAKARHVSKPNPEPSTDIEYVLDMHTVEVSIYITSLNIDLSIEQLGIASCAVDGILDFYVVKRKVTPGKDQTNLDLNNVFLDGDAWVSQLSIPSFIVSSD